MQQKPAHYKPGMAGFNLHHDAHNNHKLHIIRSLMDIVARMGTGCCEATRDTYSLCIAHFE